MFEICGWCVTRIFHESDNLPHFLARHTPYPKDVDIIYFYKTREDIDAFVAVLKDAIAFFKQFE